MDVEVGECLRDLPNQRRSVACIGAVRTYEWRSPAHVELVKPNSFPKVLIRGRIIEEERGSLVEYSKMSFRDEGKESVMLIWA